MKIPKLERKLGIETYTTQSLGIGGKIRQFPEDFVVEEILADGARAKVQPVETPHPVGEGCYLVCVLVKREWDTFRAVMKVARRMGISYKRVQIAGMKDAKALTAQHISIRGVTPERVSRVRIKDITLHSLRFSDERVHSRLLLGNNFRILIRGIFHPSSLIEKRVKNVQSELSSLGGFPNFFGHQRFGTVRPITHVVGGYLVQGNLEKAALTYLAQPSPHEHPESREARQQLQDTQDFKEALRLFPTYLRYERLMLVHLTKETGDFVGAFRKMPLKLRRLLVQAYQSFLFNKFLSERKKRDVGLNEPQVGDYVVHLDSQGLPTTKFLQVTSQSLSSVEKALKEGKTRIAIPLIGFKQQPSDGVQGEIEREILETENVAPRNFYISSIPEASAPGTLRTILAPVIDFSMKEVSRDSTSPRKRQMELGFTLHRGSYATVLLREFMKPRNLIKAGF
ncbi:MAG: tRNA pseudouridine(13) synthase TruD [Candidatus Bathyarchaeota archaeon]|nr:MAG: tRNA pseudouridine(13) synthase TruD [Candidatus Bathyarchaeota archaeon]